MFSFSLYLYIVIYVFFHGAFAISRNLFWLRTTFMRSRSVRMWINVFVKLSVKCRSQPERAYDERFPLLVFFFLHQMWRSSDRFQNDILKKGYGRWHRRHHLIISRRLPAPLSLYLKAFFGPSHHSHLERRYLYLALILSKPSTTVDKLKFIEMHNLMSTRRKSNRFHL